MRKLKKYLIGTKSSRRKSTLKIIKSKNSSALLKASLRNGLNFGMLEQLRERAEKQNRRVSKHEMRMFYHFLCDGNLKSEGIPEIFENTNGTLMFKATPKIQPSLIRKINQ